MKDVILDDLSSETREKIYEIIDTSTEDNWDDLFEAISDDLIKGRKKKLKRKKLTQKEIDEIEEEEVGKLMDDLMIGIRELLGLEE